MPNTSSVSSNRPATPPAASPASVAEGPAPAEARHSPPHHSATLPTGRSPAAARSASHSASHSRAPSQASSGISEGVDMSGVLTWLQSLSPDTEEIAGAMKANPEKVKTLEKLIETSVADAGLPTGEAGADTNLLSRADEEAILSFIFSTPTGSPSASPKVSRETSPDVSPHASPKLGATASLHGSEGSGKSDAAPFPAKLPRPASVASTHATESEYGLGRLFSAKSGASAQESDEGEAVHGEESPSRSESRASSGLPVRSRTSKAASSVHEPDPHSRAPSTAASARASVAETEEARAGVEAGDGVEEAALESPILREAIEEASASREFAPAPGDTAAVSRLKRSTALVKAFLGRVHRNDDFSHRPAKMAASVYNAGARNLCGVFLPTMLRQFVSHGVEVAFQRTGASNEARTAVGLCMPVVAVVALLVGGMRDRAHGTDTRTSRWSRATMGGAAIASAIPSALTGATGEAASNMVGFTFYTMLRDLLSNNAIEMKNPDMAALEASGMAMDVRHFLTISALYGLCQGLVNRGMSELASPSGPGAAGADVTPNTVIANAAIRGALNWAGETAEDLTFQGIPAVRSWYNSHVHGQGEARTLQLGLGVTVDPVRARNQMFGPWAVRTAILSMTLGVVTAFSRLNSLKENPELAMIAADVIIGAYNAVLYQPFAQAGSGQPVPPSAQAAQEDPELGTDTDIPLTQPLPSYPRPA